MRLAPAHDSIDSLQVGRSHQIVATDFHRPEQALATTYQYPRTIGLQVLLHVLAVCSGLALLVIAVLPAVAR